MCAPGADIANPSQVGYSVFNMERRLAPGVLSLNQAYSPAYNQLGLQNLSTFLTGNADGASGGVAGMMSSLIPQLTDVQSKADIAANSAGRTATLADATRLSPGYNALTRASNPGGAGLLDQLTSKVGNELQYGTELTPAEKMQLNQSVRGGQAARGMGFGPSDVFSESMANAGMGQSLLQQREGAASALVPQLSSFYGDPLAKTMGMGSNAGMVGSTMATGLVGRGGPGAAQLYNPEGSFGQAALGAAQSGKNTAASDAAQGFSSGMSAM